MAGNKAGGEKLRAKRIAEFGSIEAYREHLRLIGIKGRENRDPKNITFAKDRELARRAGKKGGEAGKKHES